MKYPFKGEDEKGDWHVGSLIEQDDEAYILERNDGSWYDGSPVLIYPVDIETVVPCFKEEE